MLSAPGLTQNHVSGSGFAGRRERPCSLRVQSSLSSRGSRSRRCLGSGCFRGFLRSRLFGCFLDGWLFGCRFLRDYSFLGSCLFSRRLLCRRLLSGWFLCRWLLCRYSFFSRRLFSRRLFGWSLFSCYLFRSYFLSWRSFLGRCFFSGGLFSWCSFLHGSGLFCDRFFCSCHSIFSLINLQRALHASWNA